MRIRFAVGMAVMIAQIVQRAAVEHGQAGVQQVAVRRGVRSREAARAELAAQGRGLHLSS